MSDKRLADRVSMLFTLYGIYAHLGKTDESFDEFLYWGEMLLNDFNDVDKYLVDAGSLFRNVTDLKELEEGFDFLSEEQIAAIRAFWSPASMTMTIRLRTRLSPRSPCSA